MFDRLLDLTLLPKNYFRNFTPEVLLLKCALKKCCKYRREQNVEVGLEKICSAFLFTAGFQSAFLQEHNKDQSLTVIIIKIFDYI